MLRENVHVDNVFRYRAFDLRQIEWRDWVLWRTRRGLNHEALNGLNDVKTARDSKIQWPRLAED